MSDRDVPSVPVTTLAGLSSLSDLLSELPVSESLGNATSLNRTLLFHTLVASESKNLLSVRDDNLTRQLVNAIEQTNSDNIEVKSQYSLQAHDGNLSSYPELLQGIYNFCPTVFNSNSNHGTTQPAYLGESTQQNTLDTANPAIPVIIDPASQQALRCHKDSYQQYHQPHNHQQQQQQHPHAHPNPQHSHPHLQPHLQAHSPLNSQNHQQQQQQQSNQFFSTSTPPVYHHSMPSNNQTNQSVVNSLNANVTYKSTPDVDILSTANDLVQSRIDNTAGDGDQQILYNNDTMAANNGRIHHQHQHQHQNPHPHPHHPQYTDSNACRNENSLSGKVEPVRDTHEMVGSEAATMDKSKLNWNWNPYSTHSVQDVQMEDDHSVKRNHQQDMNNSNENNCHLNNFQSMEECERINALHMQRPSSGLDPGGVGMTMEQQKLHANSSSVAMESGQGRMDCPMPMEVMNEVNNVANICAQSSTIAPRPEDIDNECASGNDPKPHVRVCVNRLKTSDVQLMQTSIKTFIEKSPALANKIGLVNVNDNYSEDIKDEEDPSHNVQLSGSSSAINTADNQRHPDAAASLTDTFTMMKANEKQASFNKRRQTMVSFDDVPPDQIFTKPKVRRVERINPVLSTKCSKDEVLRSQTYQQFMRNMEQIIELLDDTESPNFEADDVDENIECISSKMLNTMSKDVAKLKAKNVLDLIPKNKLTLLINYAMRNVYLSKNYSAGPDDDEEFVDEDVMEKILNGIEACLLVCNIYSTVSDLKFLQEDNISLILKFMQFQLRETIFPCYDPVYTVKNMKKDNRRKSKMYQNHGRHLNLLYSKVVELMKVFVMLFEKCIFVDTIVLPLSTLAVEPFFVDNIETLQFVCLELVTTIFRKEQYDKIRSSILGDILSSIDRLPSSKRNLRPFKLANNGGNIQMVTALVLQLIQCATILPDSLCTMNSDNLMANNNIKMDDNALESGSKMRKPNTDIVVLNKYDVAVSIGGNFLTTFLNKCRSKSNETDFRPLFENFIHDLLSTANKPEWPASELLLSLLGTMLVRYVSDKTIEQSIRLVSLDYLGIVAARLRKDTVESRCKVNIIDSMIKSIKIEQEREGDLPVNNCNVEVDPEEERSEFLQRILLDFLAVNAHEENLIWDYARYFYLTQWCRDIILQRRRIADGDRRYASRKKSTARKKSSSRKSAAVYSGSESDDAGSEDGDSGRRHNNDLVDQELHLEIFKLLEERKHCLINKIRPYSSISGDLNHTTSQHIKTYIDYNNAHLIAQYLAAKRPFGQSFDGYLKKIILVVNEPSIAVRTRAMKCLANIVEVDPLVLKRKDMQMGVNQKFLDTAISVREAAVDLVGKFVLSNDELIDQYYDMLSARILDTGVSVRKRVIKILRDICIEYPDFKKIPEICVKMIRRVNDEEGIQKLVTEVFMKMWFNPCQKNDKYSIQRKITQIIDVVNTAHDTGTTWLEGLLNSIFQPKENVIRMETGAQEIVKRNTEPSAEIVLACQQLADGLVDRLIELEDTDNERMLGCITTLHLLAKVRPQLLVRHAITIEPYLNIKCHPSTAPKFICAVADILEKVVPRVNNASESFLASLEEHLMLLVVSLNQAVVSSCVSCLGAVVNKITKNYKLIRDCFQKFYRILDHSRNQVVQNGHSVNAIYTPMFRRSLFTIGILMRYFDFKMTCVTGEPGNGGLPETICDETFECLMYFAQCSNYEIRKQALIALGSFSVLNDDYLIRPKMKGLYCDILCTDKTEPSIKIICMRNIWIYLTESEVYMHNKEKEWEKQSKNEDLKEMNDVSSGMASRIIQLYLQEILDCFLNRDDAVRLWAVKVVQIVLRQGLVHPVRMVPYLICLSTDSKLESAHRADALLKDIDKTYSGFVNMKVQFGLQLCFRLQEILQSNSKSKRPSIIRGYVKRGADTVPMALNDFLYTLLRTTKPQRRALVQAVTKQFDDQKTPLRQMLYIADNLAYFPYVVQDEPLYLIHQVDLLISMAGTNILTTFKEYLKPSETTGDVLEDDDDVEDPEVLFKRLPDNTREIEMCITSAQACMLLLVLKEHLKDMYGLTDSKISRYSPSEPKIYEKAITRRAVADFNPKTTIEIIQRQLEQSADSENVSNTTVAASPSCYSGTETYNWTPLSNEQKMDLVNKYLDFKQLMLKLDPEDNDSDEDVTERNKMNNTSTTSNTVLNDSTGSTTTATSSFLNSTAGGLTQSFNESGTSGQNMTTTPNYGSKMSNYSFNTSATNPVMVKQIPMTPPSSRNSRGNYVTGKSQQSTISRQIPRSRRKRRKMKLNSSDEEDEEDYSDTDDYA